MASFVCPMIGTGTAGRRGPAVRDRAGNVVARGEVLVADDPIRPAVADTLRGGWSVEHADGLDWCVVHVADVDQAAAVRDRSDVVDLAASDAGARLRAAGQVRASDESRAGTDLGRLRARIVDEQAAVRSARAQKER